MKKFKCLTNWVISYLRSGYGYGDINVVSVDYFAAFNHCIHDGYFGEGVSRCFDEGGHKAEFNTVSLEKLFSDALAQIHEVTAIIQGLILLHSKPNGAKRNKKLSLIFNTGNEKPFKQS